MLQDILVNIDICDLGKALEVTPDTEESANMYGTCFRNKGNLSFRTEDIAIF